ncbi:serine/threonine-protein kinase HAL4/sat4 [Actinomortierella ambigua]|nr:serine/threonine-protein kinase HAL4/sat4 [Actinomortierella ambigua]
MPPHTSTPVESPPSTPPIPENGSPTLITVISNGPNAPPPLNNLSRKNSYYSTHSRQLDSNGPTPLSSPRLASMSRSSTQSSIHLNGPVQDHSPLPSPQGHVATPTGGLGKLAPAAPVPLRPKFHDKLTLPSPPPATASASSSTVASAGESPSPSTSPHPSTKGQGRRVLAELPSASDMVTPPKRPGYHSASPSTHSIASTTDTIPSSNGSGAGEIRHRFERLPQGGHRHHLSAPRRNQFLASQVKKIRDFLDGKKDDPAGGGHRNHLHLHPESLDHPMTLLNEKYGTAAEEQQHLQQNQPSPSSTRGPKHSLLHPHHSHHQHHDVKADFAEKYGELQQVVGRGAFGTVRISMKKHPGQPQGTVYAIKEFKNTHSESQKAYMRRLTSEFCIASSLKHINVIQTLDLLQLHNDTYSEVMEYCAGGDLHSLIASADTLSEPESDCFFAQLINGVAFLHAMGVAHRDIKPENLLLTSDGCLKIADFGNSEVFRMPWEKKVRTSVSIRGSGPFIAPEEFTMETFDARKVDVWACGIVYMCMRLGRYNWHEALEGDPIWDGFLYRRGKIMEEHAKRSQRHQQNGPTLLPPASVSPSSSPRTPSSPLPVLPSTLHVNMLAIEQAAHLTLGFPEHIAEVIDHILEPDPRLRWKTGQILDSEWLQHVDNCHPAERPEEPELDETDLEAHPTQPVGSKVVAKNSIVAGCKAARDAKHVSQHKAPLQHKQQH